MEGYELQLLRPGAHIHFVGIGGISMSGLAEILKRNKYVVSGSDLRQSSLTDKLKKLGIKVFYGHAEENVQGADLIVYTAAVKDTNPEIRAAKKLHIPVIERAVLLGEIMRKYQYPIAVSGTHGKTTTTSMVSLILMQANLDPTILVGGELEAIDGNVRAGGSRYFVTEACEYVESFLKFYPYIGIILNIDADHLDYFRDLDHITDAFRKFAQLIPADGHIIVCGEDKRALQAVKDIDRDVITYGIHSETCVWKAENIVFNNLGYPKFDIIYKENHLCSVSLKVPGIHNVYNALAAAACSHALGIQGKDIAQGLASFRGTHRRFEIKGTINDFTIVDDYAHHPTEIKATLAAALKFPHHKLWCIFQPHTYTRTLALLEEFSQAFSNTDTVIITDIYAAREVDDGSIHSRDLVKKINEKGDKAIYISQFDDIASYILEQAAPGDLVITMGAGNVYEVGDILLQETVMEQKLGS